MVEFENSLSILKIILKLFHFKTHFETFFHFKVHFKFFTHCKDYFLWEAGQPPHPPPLPPQLVVDDSHNSIPD